MKLTDEQRGELQHIRSKAEYDLGRTQFPLIPTVLADYIMAVFDVIMGEEDE